MKVYLVHHTDALSAEQDPQRHISPKGREQADRLGARLSALGVAPVRILHSDKQWTIDTAERVDHLHDAAEADLDVVVDLEPGGPLDGLDEQRSAAQGERRVQLVLLRRVLVA